MPSEVTEELRDFHRFLTHKIESEQSDSSPEEVLDEWRRSHPQTHASDEDLAAIREALDDMAKGDRGIPFDELIKSFANSITCRPRQ
jgi:hypothetical protein